MISYTADFPISMWVQKHYPQLAAMLAATFGVPEKGLAKLLTTATHSLRLQSLKLGFDRVLAPYGLILDIRCSMGDAPSQEATRLLFTVAKPEAKGTVKPALTIGVDENGVYLDLQGLFLQPDNDTRCRIDTEAIAVQLARTPKAQPFIAAALKALPVKANTRSQAAKAVALEALAAAAKAAPQKLKEGATLQQLRYEAVLRLLRAAFADDVELGKKVIWPVGQVILHGSPCETVAFGDGCGFTLRGADVALPQGQVSLEIDAPHGQKVVMVITPRGCGIDFGYLRLSTESGNGFDVVAFEHQRRRNPAFATQLVNMLTAFVGGVRENTEMKRLRFRVMRQLTAPAELVVVESATA